MRALLIIILFVLSLSGSTMAVDKAAAYASILRGDGAQTAGERVPNAVSHEARPETAQRSATAKQIMDQVRAGQMSLEDAKELYRRQSYGGQEPPEYDYSTIKLPGTPWSLIGGR